MSQMKWTCLALSTSLGNTARMLTINIGVPFLVALLGALVFLLAPATPRGADVKELAKHAWWCGLLVVLFMFATTYASTAMGVHSHF